MTDESEAKAPWYIESIKSLGLPTCFLVALLYMIWTAGTWAGSTIVYPLFEKQTKMIDEVSGIMNAMDTSLEGINRTLTAHGEHAIESLKVCNEVKNTTTANSSKLDILTERLNAHNEKIIGVLQKIEENTSTIKDLRPSDMP